MSISYIIIHSNTIINIPAIIYKVNLLAIAIDLINSIDRNYLQYQCMFFNAFYIIVTLHQNDVRLVAAMNSIVPYIIFVDDLSPTFLPLQPEQGLDQLTSTTVALHYVA